jgi:hypothetical protein
MIDCRRLCDAFQFTAAGYLRKGETGNRFYLIERGMEQSSASIARQTRLGYELFGE